MLFPQGGAEPLQQPGGQVEQGQGCLKHDLHSGDEALSLGVGGVREETDSLSIQNVTDR
ncbi:UNVERIFIED_CONTAM: hypothetical protein FKN15_043261 [Acipenser sinensis]